MVRVVTHQDTFPHVHKTFLLHHFGQVSDFLDFDCSPINEALFVKKVAFLILLKLYYRFTFLSQFLIVLATLLYEMNCPVQFLLYRLVVAVFLVDAGNYAKVVFHFWHVL